MLNYIKAIGNNPKPLHYILYKKIQRYLKGKNYTYQNRIYDGRVERSHYALCVYESAKLAQKLGIRKISVIELGVAGGLGLINIEKHVAKLKDETETEFEVYGFDLESGLPKSDDYRDMVYKWPESSYQMDLGLLQEKLKSAELIVGDVKETCQNFFEKYEPAPIGCVFFDLDYYTSTRDSFQLFETDQTNYLPRVLCYFDDIRFTNEYVGELCAIREFNEAHKTKKIVRPFNFQYYRPDVLCADRIFEFHDFLHPKYNSRITDGVPQRPIS